MCDGWWSTGLSLTTFNVSCAPAAVTTTSLDAPSSEHAQVVSVSPPTPPLPIYRRAIVTCEVTNTGKVVGDEVLLVYHAVGANIRAAASKLHPVRLAQPVSVRG